MPTVQFFEKIADRIERIDRKSLEKYVLDAAQESKFLKTLLDQVQEGLMVLSAQKGILLINHRMIQLLNLPDTADQTNLGQIALDTELRKIIEEAIDGKKEIIQKELEVLIPRPMLLRINLLIDKRFKPAVFILSLTNLSHRETDIRERFQLANWESMLTLATGIAHEIGNPLNSLTIHLKLLAKQFEKLPSNERKKAEASLEAIEDETLRLDQIVRNFLKATRRKPLRFELISVNELIEKTLTLLKPELKKARIKVDQELRKEIVPFLADPDRLQQVFINIIKNAVHAMPGGGTLKIQTEAKEKLCFIRFQDTGVGIPQEKIPKIFDAYYTTKEEGTGLGLMIVHQIIREHGGRIEVASRTNQGTRFTLILPMRKQKLGLPQPENQIK